MSKRSEQKIIINTYIENLMLYRNGLGDFVAKHELWDKLTDAERVFMEETSKAFIKLIDARSIKK